MKCHSARCLIACLTLSLLIPALQAQDEWFLNHLTPGNNARVDFPAQFTNFNNGPLWSRPDLNIVPNTRITVSDPHLFCPVHINSPAPAVHVMALHARTGEQVWQSPGLDQGLSLSFESSTGVTVDDPGNALIYASGRTVYKLDKADGSIIWSTVIDDTNTSPGLTDFDFANASPQVGDGMVFIETYGGFTYEPKQTIALDLATGNVAWFRHDRGPGTATTPFLQGSPSRIYTTAGTGNAICYNAATGAKIWRSDVDPAIPWTLDPYILTGAMTVEGGRLYAVGHNFTDTTGTLVCANALTGDLEWQVVAPISDIPPLIIGNVVYIYGGGFGGTGDALLWAFDRDTGNEVFKATIVSFGFLFRNYMAATNDSIYATGGNNLYILDPANGNILDQLSGTYTGGVTIDEAGGVYSHTATFGGPSGLQAFGTTVAVGLDSFILE
jgi:outer membrane protein assembly factor BamB